MQQLGSKVEWLIWTSHLCYPSILGQLITATPEEIVKAYYPSYFLLSVAGQIQTQQVQGSYDDSYLGKEVQRCYVHVLTLPFMYQTLTILTLFSTNDTIFGFLHTAFTSAFYTFQQFHFFPTVCSTNQAMSYYSNSYHTKMPCSLIWMFMILRGYYLMHSLNQSKCWIMMLCIKTPAPIIYNPL